MKKQELVVATLAFGMALSGCSVLLGCRASIKVGPAPPPPPPPPAAAPAPAPDPPPQAPAYITVKERIQFETAEDVLLARSKVVLNDVVKALKENPHIHLVEIGGHTDSRGEKDDNLMLSQRRAESVRDYLVSQAVAVQRLRAMGYGDRVPVASNDTPDGREQNRRVEFRIIKQGQ